MLETAFKRENTRYDGLNTSDNKVMNRESDHFASCLLMQADRSRELLLQSGFDLLRFSQTTGRSLPSVVIRLQSLYSVASGQSKPYGAVWLYEAPWPEVEAGDGNKYSMVLRHTAQLCGFTLKKGSSTRAILARRLFPAKSSRLIDFGLGFIAVEDAQPVMLDLVGFDLFEDHDFFVIAEPLHYRGTPWRLLAAAVRKDCIEIFDPWIKRLAGR